MMGWCPYDGEECHHDGYCEDCPHNKLLECANMLQEFCSKNEGCYPCMFRDKHGECRIGMPIDWELEEPWEEGERNETGN